MTGSLETPFFTDQFGVVFGELGGNVDSRSKVSAAGAVIGFLHRPVVGVAGPEAWGDIEVPKLPGKRKFVIGVEAAKSPVIEQTLQLFATGVSGEEVVEFVAEISSLKVCELFPVNTN